MKRFLSVLCAMLLCLVAVKAEEAAKPGKPAPVVKKDTPIESGQPSRIWVTTEYYGALTKSPNNPGFPLVTSAPVDFPFGPNGTLGFPNTTVLFDKDDTDLGFRHGFKVSAGGWISEDRKLGAEVSGFWLPESSERKTFTMDSVNRLSVPYYNSLAALLFPGSPSYEDRFAYDPDQFSSASIKIGNRQEFWGAGANALISFVRKDNLTIDLKPGFRFLSLEDRFTFKQTATDLVDTNPVIFANEAFSVDGATYTMRDSFEGRNKFYGLDMGARIVLQKGRFSAEFLPRVGLGVSDQTVEIRGVSTATLSSVGYHSVYNRGGFWAQDTNIGSHHQTKFAVVPELTVKGNYDITKRLSVSLGYSVLYWSNVVNGGDQLDRSINSDKIAVGGLGSFGTDGSTPADPKFKFKETDFWAHGVNVGFKLRF